MSFNVIYVENDYKDWTNVSNAIEAYNKDAMGHSMSTSANHLLITRATDPNDLKSKISFDVDLILADMFYTNPQSGLADDMNGLQAIIEVVREWQKAHSVFRPVPIIAYTGKGQAALSECLKIKDALYDIWDKSQMSSEYVAWRLSRLAIEIARSRPDARMQRLIREMDQGATWHRHVLQMVQEYDAGWTERDQIERAGAAIKNIAFEMGVWEQCKPMWSVMTDWESLSRFASRRARGHARHVINVFWLGYYLLHHSSLRTWFAESWNTLVVNRSNMGTVNNQDPLEALSNIWFYAGLFHDMGGCIEKSNLISGHLEELLKVFGDIVSPSFVRLETKSPQVDDQMNKLFVEIGEPLGNRMRKLASDSILNNHPDHGIMAALHLRNTLQHGEQECYAREAARAMALHNLFPKIADNKTSDLLSWEKEPIVCLLLLCDQIQTWDRERNDITYMDDDGPQRAELSQLEITDELPRPTVNISIDYIAPEHLSRAPEIYHREKNKLVDILRDNPYRALKRISESWPFAMRVDCSLSGDPLPSPLHFGNKPPKRL